jgi:hypothetical protein
MSNRNFDNRVIIQRLQNQNYARNLYLNNTTGKTIINNPQNSDGNSSRLVSYVPGSQTEYFRGLVGNGITSSIGGIVNIPPSPLPQVTFSLPTEPTITSITGTDTGLTINFTSPSSNKNTPITNYEYSVDGGTSWSPAGVSSTPILVSGLSNGTTYNVTIRAVNQVGSGPASNIVSATPNATTNTFTAVAAVP